ncbi:hypothetical protein EGB_12830 [Enterococcus gallinarum]
MREDVASLSEKTDMKETSKTIYYIQTIHITALEKFRKTAMWIVFLVCFYPNIKTALHWKNSFYSMMYSVIE